MDCEGKIPRPEVSQCELLELDVLDVGSLSGHFVPS